MCHSSNINKEQKNFNIKKRWGTENRPQPVKRIFVHKPKKIIPLEKQKFKNCLISFCNGCNTIIKNKHIKYCIECAPYKNMTKFYEKLGLKGDNLKEINDKAIIHFKYLYDELEKSKIDLANEYGLNTNSIYIFCTKNNIKLRTVGEGVSMAFKNLKIQISNPCSNSFYLQKYHTGHTGQVFFCRSSYETKLAIKLDELNEYYEYEGLSIEYLKNNKLAYYLPDFYLPQYNLILEPKNRYFFRTKNEIYKSQYEAVIKKGINIHYLFEEEIKMLNSLKSFDEFLIHFKNKIYFK